jgi:hypothetical protein
MIAYSNDEQYLYTVQAMIDLDFNDSFDESRLIRTRGMVAPGPWEVA